MLKAKEAVEKATQHLLELSPEMAVRDLRMEEVVPFGSNWTITFSAIAPPTIGDSPGSMAYLFQGRRIYKVVEVDADSGEFVSLRNPAA